jgi:Zn-dependent metalloprotease
MASSITDKFKVPLASSSLLFLLFFIFFLASCEKEKNITDIAEPVLAPGWIKFKEGANINPKTLFKDYPNIFQIAPGNEMVIVSEENDDLGMVHYRYSQYFKGIPLENAEFIVHAKNNRALTANGALATNFAPTDGAPAISEEEALKIVTKRIPSEQYLREDNIVGDLDKTYEGAKPSGYRPEGTLVFAQKPNTDSQEWELAWMFKVYVLPLDNSRQIFISASNGSVLKELPLFSNCFSGSGDTTFRGNQQFNTKRANDRFYLTNDCEGNELTAVLLDSAGKKVDIFDDDNNWIGNNRSLVSSFWALDITYDYFRLVRNRRSYDGKNGNMLIRNDPNMKDGGNNATGGGGVISIGFGSTGSDNDDYNTVDIVGHEFTHSLIEKTAKLNTEPNEESSALNESFSDIFGQLVERWDERNQNQDWVIGDDKGCAGTAVICRDLKNPKTYKHPDTYKGKNWQNSKIDPHTNGGVQNRWFYLITDGEAGTNEDGIQFSVSGIGIDKSGRIVYRTLTQYLNADSDYKAAREGSINAAEDLFGVESNEVGQVIKAWCAVGLCPYTQPKQPDKFDRAGGNPNPASPNNNNALQGATPLPTGSYTWSAGSNPKLKVSKLSIYPFNDIDYFKITFPDIQRIGGSCFYPGYSFSFTNNVNAAIFVNGAPFKTYTNASYIGVPLQGVPDDFVIAVSPAFPGQIVDYDLQISPYLEYDPTCFQTAPRQKWELIRECINCDHEILSQIQRVILDPPYRTNNKLPIENHYFYYDGESPMDITIQMVNGNKLNAQLTDEKGNVITTAENVTSATTDNVVHLRGEGLREGVYSLRFNGFGNGTEINVGLPGR